MTALPLVGQTFAPSNAASILSSQFTLNTDGSVSINGYNQGGSIEDFNAGSPGALLPGDVTGIAITALAAGISVVPAGNSGTSSLGDASALGYVLVTYNRIPDVANGISASTTFIGQIVADGADGAVLRVTNGAIQPTTQKLFNATAPANGRYSGLLLAPTRNLDLYDPVTGSPLGTPTSFTIASSAVPCFCAGTMILSQTGPIAVERIRAGDRLITLADGQRVLRPVIWVGSRRVHLTPGTDQSRSAPIRIHAHAFADQQPARDLLVSPDHAVFVDGALIPARLLVNHGSITQPSGSGAVDYFHVELDRHAVILSEGLPTESYLAGANRIAFARFTPTADAQTYATHGCAPLRLDPSALLPIWTRLAERAAALGLPPRLPPVTSESDLRVLADGRPLAAIVHGDRLVVALPPGTRAVRIASRAAQPAEACPWIDDRRRIGVTVAGVAVRTADGHAAIPLDAPALADGWWDLEASDLGPLRKTNGDALLTLPPDARTLELHVVGGPAYPTEAPKLAA